MVNRDQIASSLGIPHIEETLIYLGLPITSKRLKITHFQPLLSKISALLEGWKVKFLSFAGRVQFLKFTIANTIAYWIRGAIIPKACRKHISKLCSKFLFFGNIKEKKMHIIAWKDVTRPKSYGGLGIPSFDSLYHGLACSFIGRMFTENSLLGHWYKVKYESPWKPPTSTASKFWKLVCHAAQDIKDLINFTVAPNCNFSFLWDPWFNGDSLAKSFNCNQLAFCEVKDFISNGQWNLPVYLPSDIKSGILNIGIGEDPVLTWNGISKPTAKVFKAKYFSNLVSMSWAKYIWHKRHALRFGCYSWMAIQRKLKCADILIYRGILVSPLCDFCIGNNETHSHLFFECDFSFTVISSVLPALNCFYLRPNLSQTYDYFHNNQHYNALEKNFCFLTISATVYFLWRERNKRRFSNSWDTPYSITAAIVNAIRTKVRTWKSVDKLETRFKEILD